MAQLEDLARRAAALPGASKPKEPNQLEGLKVDKDSYWAFLQSVGMTDPDYRPTADEIADIGPGEKSRAELPVAHVVPTGRNKDAPTTGAETTPGHWSSNPNARVVNFGSGKLRATEKNLGGAVGLNSDQASAILSAASHLDRAVETLEAEFYRVDNPEAPLTPEASEVAERLDAARKRSTYASSIRAALVDGDKDRLKRTLKQAGLPYGDWL